MPLHVLGFFNLCEEYCVELKLSRYVRKIERKIAWDKDRLTMISISQDHTISDWHCYHVCAFYCCCVHCNNNTAQNNNNNNNNNNNSVAQQFWKSSYMLHHGEYQQQSTTFSCDMKTNTALCNFMLTTFQSPHTKEVTPFTRIECLGFRILCAPDRFLHSFVSDPCDSCLVLVTLLISSVTKLVDY